MWSSALIVVFSLCKETEDIAREEDAKEEEMAKKEAEKKKKRKRERVCIVCHTYILSHVITLQMPPSIHKCVMCCKKGPSGMECSSCGEDSGGRYL